MYVCRCGAKADTYEVSSYLIMTKTNVSLKNRFFVQKSTCFKNIALYHNGKQTGRKYPEKSDTASAKKCKKIPVFILHKSIF